MPNRVSRTTDNAVVLVEDDDGLRRALERFLETAGFTVESFASAEGLLAGQTTSRVLCFVLDIHLPGMTGIELQRRLASMGMNAPVVFITARDSPSLRRSIALSGRDCLIKPFASEALVAAINRAVGERGVSE